MSTLLVEVPRAEVQVFETTHYSKRKKQRRFDSSILGKVVPRLCNLKIGQIAKFNDGVVSVVCRRISASSAILITGYKNDQKQTLSRFENWVINKTTYIDGWRDVNRDAA